MLRRWDEVPSFVREPHVLTGYRPVVASWRACARTLVQLHNQTLDILTHLVPLVGYTAVGVAHLAAFPRDTTPWTDYAFAAAYFLGVGVCFAASTAYHLFLCHSEAVRDAMYTLDRLGITAPFVASMLFLSYYGFACNPFWQVVHMTAAVVAALLMVLLIVHGHDHARHASSTLRVAASVSMFSVGLLTMGHMAWIAPDDGQGVALALRFLGTYVAYAIGMVFYITRFPECRWPGRFDFIGKSHQLWHIFVVIGSANFYPLVTACYAASQRELCPPPYKNA